MSYKHANIVVGIVVLADLKALILALGIEGTDGMFASGISATGKFPATGFVSAGLMPEEFLDCMKSPDLMHARAKAGYTKAGLAYPYTLAQVTDILAGCTMSDGTFEGQPESPHDYLARLGLKIPIVPMPAPPPTIPQAVTMRQARRALLSAGKLATVNAAIAEMTGVQGEAARIDWEFSNEVKRDEPLVSALGAALGLTRAQLDGLFIAAAKI